MRVALAQDFWALLQKGVLFLGQAERNFALVYPHCGAAIGLILGFSEPLYQDSLIRTRAPSPGGRWT